MEFSQSQSKSPVLSVRAPKITAHFTIWGLRKSSCFLRNCETRRLMISDWLKSLTALYSQKNQKKIIVVFLLCSGRRWRCNHRENWLTFFFSLDAVANSNNTKITCVCLCMCQAPHIQTNKTQVTILSGHKNEVTSYLWLCWCHSLPHPTRKRLVMHKKVSKCWCILALPLNLLNTGVENTFPRNTFSFSQMWWLVSMWLLGPRESWQSPAQSASI